jgi:heme-degrading monooxygenase HmoA
MLTIDETRAGQTVLTIFEVTPANCEALIEALRSTYATVISRQPGFIAAALHVNDARTRVANYSQWESREDYQAMLRTEEMRTRHAEITELCRSFEPVMIEVRAVFG